MKLQVFMIWYMAIIVSIKALTDTLTSMTDIAPVILPVATNEATSSYDPVSDLIYIVYFSYGYSFNGTSQEFTTKNFQKAFTISNLGYNTVIVNGILYILQEESDFPGFGGTIHLTSYSLPDLTYITAVETVGVTGFFGTLLETDGVDTIYICDYNALVSYSISGNTFSTVTTAVGRHDAGGMVYIDQKLYFFGGYSTSTNKIEIYDLATNAVTAAADSSLLPNDWGFFGVPVRSDGLIYLIGGNDADSSRAVDYIYVYDYTTDTLSLSTVTIPVATSEVDCSFDVGLQTIYCFGGYSDSHETTVLQSNDLTLPTPAPTNAPTVNTMSPVTSNAEIDACFDLLEQCIEVCRSEICVDIDGCVRRCRRIFSSCFAFIDC